MRTPGQALGVPEAGLHAPRPDGDRRLDARVDRSARYAGLAAPRSAAGRFGGAAGKRRRGLAIAAADGVDHAVAAHRVAEDGGARGVDEAGQHAARPGGAEAGHLVQHEQLIEGPVVERAGERLLVVVGAVGVIDRDHDVALAGQVLAEVAHEEPVARIAVRDDDERQRAVDASGAASRTAGPCSVTAIAGSRVIVR